MWLIWITLMRMFFIIGLQNSFSHNFWLSLNNQCLGLSYLTFFLLLLFFWFVHLDVRVPSAGTTTLLEGHKGLTEGASRRLIMVAIIHIFYTLLWCMIPKIILTCIVHVWIWIPEEGTKGVVRPDWRVFSLGHVAGKDPSIQPNLMRIMNMQNTQNMQNVQNMLQAKTQAYNHTS